MPQATELQQSLIERTKAIASDEKIDNDLKKVIIQNIFDQNRQNATIDADLVKFRDSIIEDRKKTRSQTPLIVSLVGGVTIIFNLASSYILSNQASNNASEIARLNAAISSESANISARIAEHSKEQDAKRQFFRDEREFAFKIVERELSKSNDQVSRAQVLLFLVRAGILNSLNKDEIENMALVDLGTSNRNIGIPPTIGGAQLPRYNVPLPNEQSSATKISARIVALSTRELNSNISEDENLDRIMEYWKSVDNIIGFKPDINTPWSGAFLSWIIREAGIKNFKTSATNLVIWNEALKKGFTFLPGTQQPQAGDIALFARGATIPRIPDIRAGTGSFFPTAVGVVYSSDKDTFQSIEPNSANALRLANRSVKAADLVGFIRFPD